MVFDEPYLVWDNSSGLPQYAKDMEVQTTEYLDKSLDDYLGKHVEIAAEKTWGYAESVILEIKAIRIL
jgi:hypothetical protein